MTRSFGRRICIARVCLLFMWMAVFAQPGTATPSIRPTTEGGTLSPKGGAFPGGVDVVLVVDNSGSMGAEIQSLQTEFLTHLVAPLVGSGISARVIVVSRHGDLASESMCFESPLSSIPPGGCANPPTLPGITDMFKHYSVEIGSLDAWCLLMSTFDGTTPDEFGLAPGGWSDWVRTGSLKVIIVVTDDGVQCGAYDDQDSAPGGTAAAVAVDTDLLALSPTDFGTSSERYYVVHSLVGLAANAPPDEPWPPSDPIVTSQCASGSFSPGTGHQGMSILTTGLRFPVCSTNDYDVFLDQVAADVLLRFPIFTDGFESGDVSAWSTAVP